MVACDLSYGPEAGAGAGNTTTVENFLPPYRTFRLQPLAAATQYWLYMTCKVYHPTGPTC